MKTTARSGAASNAMAVATGRRQAGRDTGHGETGAAQDRESPVLLVLGIEPQEGEPDPIEQHGVHQLGGGDEQGEIAVLGRLEQPREDDQRHEGRETRQ